MFLGTLVTAEKNKQLVQLSDPLQRKHLRTDPQAVQTLTVDEEDWWRWGEKGHVNKTLNPESTLVVMKEMTRVSSKLR